MAHEANAAEAPFGNGLPGVGGEFEVTPSRKIQRSLLNGHVALVVGGGRGIGAEAAVLLARAGASVVVAARTIREVEGVSELIGAEDGEAIAWKLDVRYPDQVEKMADGILRQFGRLDHVIYCAGLVPEAAFVWDVEPDQMRAGFEVNVIGSLLVVRHFVPAMLGQGEGNLVFVSSAVPTWSLAGIGVYAASRAAQNALVRTLAAEVRGSGVRVDLFTPPPTDTAALRQFRAELPGRGAAARPRTSEDPRDVAEEIVELCLPDRNWNSGGTGLGADGGYRLRGHEQFTWSRPW